MDSLLVDVGVAQDIMSVITGKCLDIEGPNVLFKLACVNHYFFRLAHLHIVQLFAEDRTASNKSLSHFVDDDHLNLCSNGVIKDAGIQNFTRLLSLNLCYNRLITDNGIRYGDRKCR
jgi:hypothetical protein